MNLTKNPMDALNGKMPKGMNVVHPGHSHEEHSESREDWEQRFAYMYIKLPVMLSLDELHQIKNFIRETIKETRTAALDEVIIKLGEIAFVHVDEHAVWELGYKTGLLRAIRTITELRDNSK